MSQDYAASSGTPVVVVEETTTVTPAYGRATRLAAEAFGSFAVVLAILSTWAFNALNNNNTVAVALAAGLTLAAAIAAVGHVSGGHFNPAVTFGLVLSGRAPWRDLAPYVLAQLVGAGLAAVVLWSIIPEGYPALIGAADRAAVMQGTANGYDAHSGLGTMAARAGAEGGFTLWSALLVEVVATAILVGVVLGTTSRRSRVAYSAVVVGLAFAALHIVTWPVTLTSLNPARSFASALFAGGWTWGQLWLFVVGPLVGAALAALFYRAFSPLPVLPGEESEPLDTDADAEADRAEAELEAERADTERAEAERAEAEEERTQAERREIEAERDAGTTREGDGPGAPRA
jgi:aquaporin Z